MRLMGLMDAGAAGTVALIVFANCALDAGDRCRFEGGCDVVSGLGRRHQR